MPNNPKVGAAKPKLRRASRLVNYDAIRALTKYLTDLADRALAFDKLTEIEKQRLERQRNLLNDAIKALLGIFDEHDVIDPVHLGPIHLNVAIAAAFAIGNQAVLNPISRRFQKENAARATQARAMKLQPTDDRIAREAKRLEDLHPDWSRRNIARAISKLINDPSITCEAIRKRLAKIGPIVRSSR